MIGIPDDTVGRTAKAMQGVVGAYGRAVTT
jgi:hypothetical protein